MDPRHSRNDLIRHSLERQGPFTVEAIEGRIGQLQERGLLIGSGPADRDRMLTTQQALPLKALQGRQGPSLTS